MYIKARIRVYHGTVYYYDLSPTKGLVQAQRQAVEISDHFAKKNNYRGATVIELIASPAAIRG